MKKIIALVLALGLAFSNAYALEIVRQKNVASYVSFPIMKTDGTLISGATGLDSEIDTWSDGAAPNGFADCTNEATEIGSTGQYYLSLTNTELNVDYAILQIKSSSTGAITQTLLIRTIVGDPLNLATTDDGGAINVTGGAIDLVTDITTKTGFSLSAAGIDAIWDEAQSGHTGAGTFGKYLDAQVSLISLTAAAIADAVWDELISGHLGAGSTGSALNAAGSAGDPWATAYPGAYGAGTFGRAVKETKDDAALAAVK